MGQTIAAFLILLTISAVFFLLRRGYPFLIIGWLWFLGMLVPMIGIVQVGLQSRADRYTYLAQIGLYLLVTWAAMGMFSKWRSGRVALIAIALLIVATLMGNSYAQTSSWRDSETVWRQNLSTTPNNYIAENGLGDALMLKGKVDDAILHFRKALEICPDCWEVHFNLAHVLAKKGDWQGAITSYRASMRAWRTPNPRNHNDLGICLAQIGKTDEAIEQFNEALRIDGNFPDAHRNLAVVLLQLGRRDEAITQFKEVLRLTPNDPKIKAQLQQLEAGN